MSYILDALRKAEADRKLGETAGLHDPTPMAATDGPAGQSGLHRWLPGVAIGLLLGLTGTLAWMLMTGDNEASLPAPANNTAAGTAATDAMVQTQPTPERPANRANGDEPVVQLPRVAASPAQPQPTSTSSQLHSPTADGPPARKLTPELRASLPPLAVGGAMYSDAPASRMVVINGQLYREGDTVAPGLTLEKIQLKSAILRHQGQRYILDY